MTVVSKNIRCMRVSSGKGRQIQYMLLYTCVHAACVRCLVRAVNVWPCGCDGQRSRADIIGIVDNIDHRGLYRSCAVIFGYRPDFASRPWKSAYFV